jgi:hypothetical protein
MRHADAETSQFTWSPRRGLGAAVRLERAERDKAEAVMHVFCTESAARGAKMKKESAGWRGKEDRVEEWMGLSVQMPREGCEVSLP